MKRSSPTPPPPPERDRRARTIAMLTYPGAQMLDVTGPLEVFSTADRIRAERGERDPGYAIEIVATRPGAVRMSSGVEIVATRSCAHMRCAIDTLIVCGGDSTADAMRDPALVRFLRRAAPRARRVASVCSGAFLLARVGLLEGKRATTHWASCDLLARLYPGVRVEPDRIYVRDGRVYTSAGVCAGMDLALALVEEDHGRALALAVARRLVLFLKRPGGQSQFSAQLSAQLAEHEPLRDLQGFIADNPDADLSVEALAKRAGMSCRNFARVFAREVGTTPARYVEQVRIEAARRRLEESSTSVERVAADCGFGTAETMRRAFLRGLRVSPTDYRDRFRADGSSASPSTP